MGVDSALSSNVNDCICKNGNGDFTEQAQPLGEMGCAEPLGPRDYGRLVHTGLMLALFRQLFERPLLSRRPTPPSRISDTTVMLCISYPPAVTVFRQGTQANKKGSPQAAQSFNQTDYLQGGPAFVRKVPLSENQPCTPTDREL